MCQGERKFEAEEENFHRIERSYGSFFRAFTLPSTVDTENVQAKYNAACSSSSFEEARSPAQADQGQHSGVKAVLSCYSVSSGSVRAADYFPILGTESKLKPNTRELMAKITTDHRPLTEIPKPRTSNRALTMAIRWGKKTESLKSQQAMSRCNRAPPRAWYLELSVHLLLVIEDRDGDHSCRACKDVRAEWLSMSWTL